MADAKKAANKAWVFKQYFAKMDHHITSTLRSEVAWSSGLTFYFAWLYRNKYFLWSVNHDVNMCHDVLVSEPFNFKSWSPEGGTDWEKISQELNAIQNQKIQSHYLPNLKSSHKMLTKIKRQKRKRQLLREVRKQAMERKADTKKRENPNDECGMQTERKR